MFFSAYPWLYTTMYKFLGNNRRLLVNAGTDIVIEGFPRSGNTFAVVAFEWAQTQEVKIAHHLHAASQIIWAAERNIPAVMLIRLPKDAVVSLAIREPHISINDALNEYIRFYELILPYKNDVLVVRFEDVVSDFGKVTDMINQKFNMNYKLFVHTEDNVEKVFDLVQQYGLKETNKKVPDENMVARPSEDRKIKSKVLLKDLSELKYKNRLNRAQDIYNHFFAI